MRHEERYRKDSRFHLWYVISDRISECVARFSQSSKTGLRTWKRWSLVLLSVMTFSCTTTVASNHDNAVTNAEQGNLTQLVITEPTHGIGYLPLYAGIHKGFFVEEGLEVEVATLQGGGAHTTAVLTGEAWAFIGGPEHNAFAKAKGAELRAIANVVDRGNVYLVARNDLNITPDAAQQNLGSLLRDKRIAVGFYGGTPNSILRYILSQEGLNPQTDVILIEGDTPAGLAAVKTKQADFAITSEPILTQGIRQGIWSEPIYNIPKELGPYAYSTINIRQESIEQEPEIVAGFTKALHRSIRFVYDNPEEAAKIAAKEFPTMAQTDLKATLDRAFADQLWSPDGMIRPEAWQTGHAVVRSADILKQDIGYDEIIDMQFVQAVTAEKST